MTKTSKSPNTSEDFRCPTCRAALKRRRSRRADECELVCGGCGETFDGCDLETVQRLKDGDAP